MSIITLDFETYYDKDYSLSKMTTEEYINDGRFQVIGVSIKAIDGLSITGESSACWFDGYRVDHALRQYDWSSSILICHNNMFDGTILKWKYGIEPNFYADTLCMARAVEGPDVSVSLASLVQRYGIGVKGDEVQRAIGKRLEDFTTVELLAYARYCCNDTELTYKLFQKLADGFPTSEMELIDETIRMFVNPVLQINSTLLKSRLIEVAAEKSKLLRDLMGKFSSTDEKEVQTILASSRKFSKVLEDYGIEVPLKANKHGINIPALAKTDLGFIALEESEDPFVQQLCAARLGTKSTLEESRIERFIGINRRNRGFLPVPLKYYAAHPGRWGGMDAINLQNLPTRDAKKKTLKTSIVAPVGHKIVHADLAQIEARILAWLAGQDDVVEAFRLKRDIYCEDASKAYGRQITKEDKKERFIGKTMRLGLGYGTGADKLQRTLKQGGAEISVMECTGLVVNWRRTNMMITSLWNEGNILLRQLMEWPEDGQSFYLGKHEVLGVTPYGIHLPNGLYIRYSNLRMEKGQVTHDSRSGPKSIWGGVVTENVVQALARLVIAECMVKLRHIYRIALTVHDSLVMVVPQEQLDSCVREVEATMTTPPAWAPGLPVAVEIKIGENYGEC